MRWARPYFFRLMAAFKSRSLSGPQASQRKTLWERGIFLCRCPQREHSRVEGKLLGATMRVAPYHFAL
jgi:hypothetical protein